MGNNVNNVKENNNNNEIINKGEINMNKSLQIIKEQEVLGKQFRIYGSYENPLFLAKDVAEWISHSNSRMMLQSIDEDEKVCVNNPYALKGQQEQWFLTEDGLYEVLMQSRKPIAKQFKKEVKKILKSIRKNGAYLTPQKIEEVLFNPDVIIQLATNLKEEQEKNKKLQEENIILIEENQEMKPKSIYCDKVLQSDGLITITQIAKDYGYSGKEFNKILHNLGIQYKQGNVWLLYSKYQDKGYTQSKTYFNEDTNKSFANTQWTQKGRLFLYEFLKECGILPLIERNENEDNN